MTDQTIQNLAEDGSFQVKIPSTGKCYIVAKNQTVVDALKQQGVDIVTSCGEGVCGTCITGVLEGEPDHKDFYFTEEEQALNNQFTPCCSRSKSAVLVLDL